MATMTIRNVDDALKTRLRVRAAMHGRSMEEEARDILRSALSADLTETGGFARTIRARIEPLGGVDLPEIEREPIRTPPDFAG